ncbi:MAG TPA: desulfoferrodoxin family protein [Methylomirabilota bacterium]|nr:desulfoferrodoxin family protein [Methylomirabilota bacterium]
MRWTLGRTLGAATAAVWLLTAGSQAVYGGQEEQFTPEFKQTRSSYDPKHTPAIKAPDSVKRGQWFDVTVSIGAGDRHPSLAEHFIRYIALYKDGVEISRAYLHPVFSAPQVTFTIALDEGGMLRAQAEPTHSAAWETSKKIAVTP